MSDDDKNKVDNNQKQVPAQNEKPQYESATISQSIPKKIINFNDYDTGSYGIQLRKDEQSIGNKEDE